MGRVVLQKMRIGCCITQVVDCHHLELVLLAGLKHRSEDVAANPAKTIDCYLDRHELNSLYVKEKTLRLSPAPN